MRFLARAIPIALIVACSNEIAAMRGADATTPFGVDASPDASDANAAGDVSDARQTCHNVPVDADARRAVVVSHPFGADGGSSGRHELLVLEPSGTLTRPGTIFDLGEKSSTEVTFTPDGALGFVALDDGAIGAFSIAPDFTVKVVNAHFSGTFHASRLAVSPHGHSLVVVDSNTTENGGGLYRLAIDCDGTLHEQAKIASMSSAFSVGLFSTAPWLLFLPGRSVADAGPNDDLFLFEISETSAIRRGSGIAFSDADEIVSAIASTEDGAYVLAADDSIVAGSRVAVFDTKTFRAVKQLTAEYPSAIVTSPYNNAALVVSSDTVSKLRIVRYDSSKSGGDFNLAGEIAYTLGKPSLPQRAVGLRRGTRRGRVLVTEVAAIRQVQFGADGTLGDVSILKFESGAQNIVGSLGMVQ